MIVLCIGVMAVMGYLQIQSKLPNEIRIIGGKEQALRFGIPASGDVYEQTVEAGDFTKSNIPKNKLHLNFKDSITIKGDNTGEYEIQCKLFGIIPLKNVKLEVIEEKELIPAGLPIGTYVKTKGVLVIGTGTIRGMDGINYEPANNLLLSGDYIETLNGQEVKNKEDLIQKINQSNGKETVLGIRRGKESFGVKVMPIQTSPEEYKIGIWVRDNTQGIGTLTFLDEFNGFGALGHGINDVDTSKLMELEGGFLYHTEIVSVIKGESGNPGELTGVIDYAKGNVLGTILKNTNGGIFGSGNSLLIDKVGHEALPICLKQDIKLGPGKILCSVNGTPVYYDVEITKVDYSADSINKGIVFKVRDENLLALTGGIVQGMSGSPIIQDGKFVGAVTHVFVQDSTKGFGIFIENMLEANLE